MPGRGDGDGGRERGNTKKRALDDALQALGLGAVNPDAKRRHTAGGPGHHDSSASTSSSFNSSGQAGESNSPSRPFKIQLDTPLFPSRLSGSSASSAHHSWRPPKSTGSPPRALGASGGPKGATSGHAGLPLNTYGRLNPHPLKQPSVPNGPPTSSSTSSHALSIPAGSDKTSAFIPFKQVPEASSRSLRYGQKLVDRAAAGENTPQTQDKAGQGARPFSTEHFAAKQQNRQFGAQDRPSNPSSHTKGKSTDPYELSSSDDDGDLYVDDGVDDADQDDDDNAGSFPSTRQRSAQLKSRGSKQHAFQNPSEGRLVDEHTSKRIFYKTPSGKDYQDFKDNDGQMCTVSGLIFPDGWTLRPIDGVTGLYYFCPVRNCQLNFNKLSQLKKHFRRHHWKSKFNDNLDEKGTLEFVGRIRTGRGSIVVSQNPLFSLPGLSHPPYASNKSETEDRIELGAIKAGMDGYGAGLVVSEVAKGSPDPQDMDPSSHEVDEHDSTSMGSSELDMAMEYSNVWAYVAPMVLPTWPSSVTGDLETKAFIQAISLPLRNKLDKQWLEGTKRSHQKTYRALMSTIFQVIGVEALCKPCESKIAERRRNCKVLPPEAEGMRELQEVYGSQCVNCYFFQATKSCEFSTSSSTTKQTPVPVPAPPAMRPTSKGERSLDPPSSARPPPSAATRPLAPSYSSYKATKADKPISESPVPIPSFAMRPANYQSQQSQTSDASPEKRHVETMRRSRRVAKIDDHPGGSSSVRENDNADEAGPHFVASTASSTSPSESVLAPNELASGGPSARESTTATSTSGSGVISSSQLAGRAFSLFGDISRLPIEEQTALWTQMQQMAEILQTGTVTNIPILKSATSDLPSGPPAVAAEWEIAPGKITVGNEHLAFSTSFLSRNAVSMKAAQQLSPTQRVLNKSMAALFQLRLVQEEEDWECTCSVIRGVLKMKLGDVETRIGQGGVIIVKKECIITNISHKEARIQVWWRKTDD